MVNYRDMLGMYRAAIVRGINIIATDEGELSEEIAYKGVHKNLLRIVDAVDGPFTLLDDNLSILDNELGMYSEEEIAVLEKMHIILSSLPEVDREIYKRFHDE